MNRILSIAVFLLMLSSALAFQAENNGLFADSPFGPLADRAVQSHGKSGDPTKENSIIILNNGYDALLLRIHLIRNAKSSINMQTFIWRNDECGRLMMYELIEAAKRGVKVRIIVDHFGVENDPQIIAFLSKAHPNLEIKIYRPATARIRPSVIQRITSTVLFFRDTNQRMHNKILTFDDMIAITGGRNIEDKYFDFSTEFNFKDRDAAVIGPLVPTIVQSFEEFWKFKHAVASTELKDVAQVLMSGSVQTFETIEDFEFNGLFVELRPQADDAQVIRDRFLNALIEADKVEFLSDLPGKKQKGWLGLRREARHTKRLMEELGKIKSSLIIQSPYLVLSPKAEKEFRRLKDRNPDVDIVISTNSFGATDNEYAYAANYGMRTLYINELGFRIYEFKPYPEDLPAILPRYAELQRRAEEGGNGRQRENAGPYLAIHAKAFIADDRLAYIGSYNMDPRSGNLNTEVGLLIEDAEVVKALKEDILNDTKPENSWVIGKVEGGPAPRLTPLIEKLTRRGVINLWPFRSTSSFELKPGKDPLSPYDERFHENYDDVGSFPGVSDTQRDETFTRFFSEVGKIATPLI